MEWLTANMDGLLVILIAVSELSAAIAQMAFPSNKGVTGVIAGIIKFLQNFKANREQKKLNP